MWNIANHLYEAERIPTPAEIRAQDERIGELAKDISDLAGAVARIVRTVARAMRRRPDETPSVFCA
ncbi:MAG TPA: hypothetical protein VFB25_05905 [Gaiellaceae bacterium]|nr:hypothetical protein [Gaiellaceae bacterium]